MKNRLILLFLLLIPFWGFQKKEKTWVAIGDSITYLNDHLNETGNRVEKGYMTRVTEKLPYIKFINQGHNGWTAQRIAQKIEELGIIKADYYTVFLGTNDWWGGVPLGTLTDYKTSTGTKTVYGSFRIIINKLKLLNPDAKIALITPLQRGDFVYVNSYKNNAYGSYRKKKEQDLADFAQAVVEIAKLEGYPVLDLYQNSGITQKNMVKFKRLKNPTDGEYKNYKYPDYIDVPFDPENDEYPYPIDAIDMTYDGLHPSDKGNVVIAKMLVKVFSKWH